MSANKKLPDEVLEYFRKQGSIGGKKRAEQLTPEERSEQARKAVISRWSKHKQGKKNPGKKTR